MNALGLFSQNSDDVAAGAVAGGFFLFSILFWVVIMGLVITITVFWIMSLVHVLQHHDVKDRVVWIIILLVIGNISGLIYYFAVKRPYDHGGMRDPSAHSK